MQEQKQNLQKIMFDKNKKFFVQNDEEFIKNSQSQSNSSNIEKWLKY